ncbi:creatininase [Verminephrobacter eiseniae]|uniref:creatininase n=1 Tax=Verminephrobacter eiseniae TaxID=364317 RepID=UPI0022372ED4|nr:creatininase [Verminephrobacter eiseniae]
MNALRMDRLSWMDYAARIQRDQPAIFLPVGALEQHGPHLPLGTDGLLAAAVAADTARLVGGLLAPTLSYGYKSQPKCGGGQHFSGTTSVDAATLIGSVRDAVREFARHGATRLVVVNGHYENQWFLIEGIDLGLRDLGPQPALQVMRLEYWDFLTAATLADVFPDGFPGFALEHAAVIETSMMLHYHPSLVRTDLIPDEPPADFPPYDRYPTPKDWGPPSGVLSSAKGASAEKGRRMAHELAQRMAAAVARALR